MAILGLLGTPWDTPSWVYPSVPTLTGVHAVNVSYAGAWQKVSRAQGAKGRLEAKGPKGHLEAKGPKGIWRLRGPRAA